MEKKEISLGEFIDNYSFGQDHVHLSAIICKGQIGVDPIVLYKNKEKRKRASKKFPGTGFDLNFLEPGFLTGAIEKQLKDFGFEEYEYKNLLNFYKENDSVNFSVNDFFLKSEYLFFFKKALILGVLEKTGFLIDFEEIPFYLDIGVNEADARFSVYRLFFIAKTIKSVNNPKNNKGFYDNHSKNVSLLSASNYLQIYKSVENGLRARYDVYNKLLYTYYPPLIKILNGL